MSSVVEQAFTELAPSYVDTMDHELKEYWGVGYREFVSRLVASASIRPGEMVLDIATGTAIIPLEIIGKTNSWDPVVGLDITPAMLRQGHKYIQEKGKPFLITLVCASAMEMPFKEGAFNVAVCGLGTHHMEVPRMLSEVKRVLAKGGRLVITDVGASAFWRSQAGKLFLKLLLLRYGLLQGSARAEAEIEAFKNVRTADEWRDLLAEYGFVEIRVTEHRARRPWYPCALTLTAELGTQ